MAETRVDAWRFGSTHVVAVHGPLDLSAGVQLRLVLFDQLDNGARQVAVDLSGVTIIDASAVGTLLGVREQLRQRGGDLRLQGVGPLARQVLEISGAAKALLGQLPTEHTPAPTTDTESRPGRWGADIDDMVARLAATPADHPERAALRGQLIESCLPYAERLARRFHGLGEPTADLNQVAALGLIQAIDRFDPNVGSDLARYAATTIIGSLKRHFRDRGWSVRVPRRLKDLRLEVNQAVATLAQHNGHAPTTREIADHLHVEETEVVEAATAANAYRASSIFTPTRTNGHAGAPAHWFGQEDADLTAVEDREALRSLLAALPEREQKIMSLRFYGNQTQDQIAHQLGISQMHVSRLISRVLSGMREKLLAAEGDESASPRAGSCPGRRRSPGPAGRSPGS
jgi:RNA polymerase sigma-B factor